MGSFDETNGRSLGEPTSVRHHVLALTTLMAVLLYLDRVCISVAAPLMAEEYCLNKGQLGLIFGVFFFSYALAQVPAGWLGDRLGPRVMLTASVLAWSLCTGLTGVMPGLAGLVAVRLVFGISQAGAYPIAARINSLWIPFHRRAFASSMVALGGRLGGALAPMITVFLMGALGGWRSVFWCYALLGVGWSILFWQFFRAAPAMHPSCNEAEAHLIESGRPPQASSPHGAARAFPIVAALRSVSLWMQCLMQLATNVAWVFLITWLPFYFTETFQTDAAHAGILSTLPLLGAVAGCFLGGVAADALTRKLGLRWGRSATGIAAKALATAGLIGAISAQDAWAAALSLTFFAFATDLGMGATWAYFQDAGGPYVGTLLGWANMFGNLGAFLSPIVIGGLVGEDRNWTAALTLCAAVTALGGFCWLGVNACTPIVPIPVINFDKARK